MKRVKKADQAAVRHLSAMESEVFRDLMPLVEFCSMLQYEDGEPRQAGWFTVRTNGSAWQVVVKDPDSASSFIAVGKTLDDALTSAALLLACEEAPWEPDQYLAAQAARKRKK